VYSIFFNFLEFNDLKCRKVCYEFVDSWQKHKNWNTLSAVPDHNVPCIILPGYHHLECSYGPERNQYNKQKTVENREYRQRVCVNSESRKIVGKNNASHKAL